MSKWLFFLIFYFYLLFLYVEVWGIQIISVLWFKLSHVTCRPIIRVTRFSTFALAPQRPQAVLGSETQIFGNSLSSSSRCIIHFFSKVTSISQLNDFLILFTLYLQNFNDSEIKKGGQVTSLHHWLHHWLQKSRLIGRDSASKFCPSHIPARRA